MLVAASKQSGVGVFGQDSDSILPKMEENANVKRKKSNNGTNAKNPT